MDLTTGAEFLREAARRHFQSRFGNPVMHVNRELHKDLAWTPALRFLIHEQVNVFVEPSESGLYPTIFELKSREVREFPVPIAIYAVTPEEALAEPGAQKELKRLEADGFGLLAVDSNGEARLVVSAIPIIQIIPRSEVEKELK